MPMFRYRAVSPDGRPESGVIRAVNRDEAVRRIRENGAAVLSVRRAADRSGADSAARAGRPFPDKQLALICSQFAIILRAGLSVVRAAELIAGQTGDRRLSGVLRRVAEDVSAGYGLASAFVHSGKKLFPAAFVETVRAGEESGTLTASFEKLSAYYSRSSQVKNKASSAMLYPAFLLALTAGVVAVIMTVTMPTFTDVFQSMDMELPALTRAIIAISAFFSQWWWALAMAVLASLIGMRLYVHTEEGTLWASRWLLKLPVLGRVNRMKAASQFANTMSTLLTAGIPLIRCVEIVSRVLDNRLIGLGLSNLVPRLEEGRSLGGLLRENDLFPAMLCEMTAMGEDTGTLEKTLDTVGEYYDAETESASKRALSLLQPAITVVLGILIGIIVIGLYLPMFTMYQGI